MKQVVQPTAGGPVRVVDVPRPVTGPTDVLVQTMASVISPGTERAVTALARSSLLGKARARPDLVKQVLKKARTEGVKRTLDTVRSRLAEDVPLGYSAAGRVVEVGEAVPGIAPGMLVATAGAGKANHAEYQAVPGLLCARVPEGVEVGDAAFGTLGSIALHGLRLAELGLGERVVFIGLGLVGQLGTRLAAASGLEVAGIDVVDLQIEKAKTAGVFALREEGDATTEAILDWTNGEGADAVIVTAADPSSRIIERIPALCRDRATVVIVGDVGLDLTRTPFYEKELHLRFSRSYGPGRYDPTYESWGVDYPSSYVRWTEGRNLATVLDMIGDGRLVVSDLVTHRFDIADAANAYELIQDRNEPYIGIQISYQHEVEEPPAIQLRRPVTGEAGIGLIGAGAFASAVLVPSLTRAGFSPLVSVTSASGLSARALADHGSFEKVVSGADTVIQDPDVDVVVIATPHSTHADLTTRSLAAGKHVFCEKPLALTEGELDRVVDALAKSEGILFVGFNRRWSEPVRLVLEHFRNVRSPLTITYRVNAPALPSDHWYHDRREGGRLLGEVCHFIDTCAALVGEDAATVSAVGSGGAERLLADHLAVTLTYPNGSVAAITYEGFGSDSAEKERVEIIGGGHSATIVDFRDVIIDGKPTKRGRQDKGHDAEMKAFRAALADGSNEHAQVFVASTRTTLQAADALLRE